MASWDSAAHAAVHCHVGPTRTTSPMPLLLPPPRVISISRFTNPGLARLERAGGWAKVGEAGSPRGRGGRTYGRGFVVWEPTGRCGEARDGGWAPRGQ